MGEAVVADAEVAGAHADEGAVWRAGLRASRGSATSRRSRSSRGSRGRRRPRRGTGNGDESGRRSGSVSRRPGRRSGRSSGRRGSGGSATAASLKVGSAVGGRAGSSRVGVGRLEDLAELARVGDVEHALAGGAPAVDIGDEQLRERVEEAVVGRAARDGDGGAVHVHLAVADLVEPGPGEGGVAAGDVLGDGDVELADAVDARVVAALLCVLAPVGVLARHGEVALRLDGAAADDGVDGLPLGRVRRRGEVVSQRKLARATAVLGTACELDQLGLARSDGRRLDDVREALAGEWEAGAKGVDLHELGCSLEVVGRWRVHDEMAIDCAEERGDRRSGKGVHLGWLAGWLGPLNVYVVCVLC
jgi:hypothetical protein